ncbi:MAG TPA: FkbM family methyltransferase [Alphaproteobacteria bacterium]|nr:FkbM family methyltransferase [Alphaproteobacteria bacterium]
MPLFAENTADLFLVNGRHGAFLVNRHDCYVGVSLIVYGEYSEAEWRMIDRFLEPGNVAMDVGANIGAFTVPMARKVGPAGRVLCFEPQPYAAELLNLNLSANGLANVALHNFGLSSCQEQREAELPVYTKEGNFGGVCFINAGKGLAAEFKRLDDVFTLPRLDFIKLDIEGMENDMLMGAFSTLKRTKPVMYVENHPGPHSPLLIKTLFDLGYRLWWHTPYYFNPQNYLGQKENLYGGQLSVNMLCLPAERLELNARVPEGLIPIEKPEDSLRAADGSLRTSLPHGAI